MQLQAPETPDKSAENFNIIECNEESSTKSGSGMMTKWFNKSRHYLFGKERCVCCCPTQNRDTSISDLAVREVPTSEENKSVCDACYGGMEKTGTCLYLTGCTCGFISVGFCKDVRKFLLGCVGYVISECIHLWHRCHPS